jgi:putative membrane-bound dehydrogenase-like protein
MVPQIIRRSLAVGILVAIALATALTSVRADEANYSVGVAKIDITPNYPIRLNGFGFRRTESEGVTQRIWAKAIAIGADEEKPLILITIDSLGVRLPMIEEVAKRLKSKAGIERDRIAVMFTHCHTTPKLNGASDTVFSVPIPPEHQAHIDRYDAEITDALEKVAIAALADRKPAKLAWAVGEVGFAKNRRTKGGPVDHQLPVLVVKSADNDAVRAVYVTYACHCVTLSNNKISGDWAGYAAEAIQRDNPGAIALVSIGCGSDSNPSSDSVGGNVAVAAEQGAEIAHEVQRLQKLPLKPIIGPISTTLKHIELPLKPLPSRDKLESLAANNTPEGYNAKYQLAKLDRGEPLQSAIDYPIQTWAFGDSLAMVFLAGEVCVDYSIRLKQDFDPARLWIHGYSNDFCCYVPSERLLREGGYGGGAETVYFGLPATLRTGVEDKIITEVHRQVPTRFQSKGPSKKDAAGQSLSPAESLAAIHLAHDDLIVELMAAEPMVADPVAIDFGADRRLWVAEMRDYSRGVNEKFEQTGQVTVLRDTDGNGSLDQSTAFVGGLRFPTDVKAWGRGVIVCDAPDVIYMEDTDGDGRADLKKTLLTGFATHNAQARVNSMRWGLDGWLYGSCGLFGGHIKSFNGQELELGSRDFRFQPDTGKLEAVTGRTQQGRARDDWQNWFGCENGTLIKHYPLIDRYFARKPHITPPADEIFVPSGSEPNQLFPLGELILFKLSGAPGRPTSACGLEIYRDELLGSDFRGNSFSCEPVNQLVHRLVLSPRGITFAGERADGETEREFLASTDQWFRPVQARTGPDGCLWIVDMHRKVIEHPRFIPKETLDKVDVMAGHMTGRIFRVRPKQEPPRPWLRLDQLTVPALVAALDSPNGPQRDMAQQLLMQKRAVETSKSLEQLLRTAHRPEVRLQALYTIAGLGKLTAPTVEQALHDAHPALRRHGLIFSEPLLAAEARVADSVLSLENDADPQVQMQLAYSLGEWRDSRADTALAHLAITHRADPYILSAVLSSAKRGNAATLVHGILADPGREEMPRPLVDATIALASRLGDSECSQEVFAVFSRAEKDGLPTWRLVAAADLLRSLDGPRRNALLHADGNQARVKDLAAAAQTVLQKPVADESVLLAALRLMVVTASGNDQVRETVARMLGPQSSPGVQQAAMSVLAESKEEWAGGLLLENWAHYTPAMRERVLPILFERPQLTSALLSAMKTGEVKASDLNASQRQKLIAHADPAIRAESAALFTGAINSDRAKVLLSYADVRQIVGDVARGRALFVKNCSSCHKLEGQGYSVGPDLAALTDRSVGSLLESVLDPNRAIDERYQSFRAITDDGITHNGILLRENATSITLLGQQGKEETLLRRSFDDFVNSRISLMPEGFERDLSKQDMADVLAYVASQGVPAKQLAGNRPEVVRADSKGIFWLLAANAKIYGQDITFESPTQNIGYWHGPRDYVAWDLNVESARSFDVYLNWACSDDTAGSIAVVEGFENPLRTVVGSTHGFDRYETKKLGAARLMQGANRIIVCSEGAMAARSLMDLRGLYLVPAGQPARLAEAGAPPNLKITDAASAIMEIVARTKVGTPAEYANIPKIWEIAIAAGRRNNPAEVTRVLAVAIPDANEPMQHWQAVALGGGIINGLSQAGCSPRIRIMELLEGKPALLECWKRTIQLADAMADDEAVRVGTRYDALRLLSADTFERTGPHLTKYLRSDTDGELVMGAISSLADIESPAALQALAAAFPVYSQPNQALAIKLLLRNDSRIAVLLNAIEKGTISPAALSSEQWSELKKTKNQELRTRIVALQISRSKRDGAPQSVD